MDESDFFEVEAGARARENDENCASYIGADRDGATGGLRVLAGAAALSDQDLTVLSTWTNELRACLWCRVRYLEINNVGEWHCQQHIGCLIDGVWTCCRRQETQRGCVRSHHRWCVGAYSEQHEEPLVISLSLARRIGQYLDASSLRRSSPEMAALHDYVVVLRYDAQAALVVFETRRPLEETYAYDARKAALSKVPRALREFW